MTGVELGLLGLLILAGILNGIAWRAFERNTKRQLDDLLYKVDDARERLQSLRSRVSSLEDQAEKADFKKLETALNTDHETLKNVEQRLAALGAELGYDWQQQKTWAHWKKREAK